MADQRENDASPTGLGLSFNDKPNDSEPQHDASQEPGEVEDLTDESFDDFDRDFTNDVEHRAESLRVATEHAPADAHEIDSQPGSAFSASSSEGAEDAEDEAEERDERDDGFQQAEEWHNVENRGPSPLPPFRAISGRTDGDEIDHIYRVDPRNGRRSPMHPNNGPNRWDFRKKMKEYSLRPSKRQKILTSPPVSPDYNNGMPAGMGIIPEPSPETEEDEHVVSPLSQHEASEPAPEPHVFASDRVWSEEDEEDTSWVSGAIAEVTESRRGSTESTTADLPEQDTEDANGLESFNDTANPLSPVSPLDKDGALDALRDDSDSAVEDDGATSSVNPNQHSESSQEITAAPIAVDAVTDQPPSDLRDPTSPDPLGPEFLTGLTPEEGMRIWWKWHDHPDKPSFNTNRNPLIQNKSGDFKFIIDSSSKYEAAIVLSKQRFLLNRMTSRDVSSVATAMSDVERTLEYMRIQMLKYRSQRNEYQFDVEDLEAKVGRRNETIQEQEDRIARRNNTIQEQEDRIGRRDKTIEENEEELQAARSQFFFAVERAKEIGAEKEKIVEAAKAMHAQKETAVQAESAMRAEKEKLERMLEQKINEAQRELDSRKKPLQFASIMTVLSHEPVASEASDARQLEEQVQSQVDDLTIKLAESKAAIEGLEADNIAWQRYADETIAVIQAEKDAADEEASGLKDALLDHGWSACAPARKHTIPLTNGQGTQTEPRAPSALPRSPVNAVPAPLKATKKQQMRKTAYDQHSNWADRKNAIMRSQSAAEELELRRVARKKRQAVELERLDQIQQRMAAFLNFDEQLYVPMEVGRVAVAV
ncbi:hypothetical protein Q7P35_000212 [Cladosporium inversicolor]